MANMNDIYVSTVYCINIEGKKDGSVKAMFSFNPQYCETCNTDLKEVVSIAIALEKTLKELREVNSSQGQEGED